MHGWVVANLKRSTRYWVRRRRRGRRRLQSTSVAVPFTRSRTRRRNPLFLLLSLTMPGVGLAIAGLPRLLHTVGGLTAYTYAVCMILAFIFALRAYTKARAPAWIRAAGVVASFLYPALYALARAHVIGA
jgi:hypothetical protein